MVVHQPVNAIAPYETSSTFLTSNSRDKVRQASCSNNADVEISENISIIHQQLGLDVGAFTLYSIDTSGTVASVAPSSYKDVCSSLVIPFVASLLSTTWLQLQDLSVVKPRI